MARWQGILLLQWFNFVDAINNFPLIEVCWTENSAFMCDLYFTHTTPCLRVRYFTSFFGVGTKGVQFVALPNHEMFVCSLSVSLYSCIMYA